ncbi:TRAP-type C4-dicarboxylate transport system, substrate-binding protein [Albimonas donghaensis]|uniref:TRAP-type C4-dicarboxylate transport system, substrate-binding protein n=1 Tax=Albimonas donghaensis TaxID=356660 RepID=A0A1H3DTQ1_9RHOB|nr:TRAP transporter substrate-binding protein DctP [Albimonas donghaensis]SDX69785.1 TRAP-type C4-dicarboxylate transport system, substrate-binding protein [Albimonas donghaensis]
MRNTVKTLLAAAAAFAFAAPAAAADYTLKMSIDGGPSHHRTKVAEQWVKDVAAATDGKLEIELFHSAQLFKDRDVPRALRQGALDIGMPGNWVLGGLDPNNDIFLLPMFYGIPIEEMHKISDGPVGEVLGQTLAEKLNIRIIGKWLDHGYSDLHATYPVESSADLAGKRVRSFGGAGTEARIRAFDGDPVLIPWADVPLALSQGNFDAMYSVSASVSSAKLWDAGITYTVAENAFFHQYLPMISESALEGLPEALAAAIFDTWAENVEAYRAMTAAASEDALSVLEANGITVVRPAPADLAASREMLMETQPALVEQLNIDPALVEQAIKDISAVN